MAAHPHNPINGSRVSLAAAAVAATLTLFGAVRQGGWAAVDRSGLFGEGSPALPRHQWPDAPAVARTAAYGGVVRYALPGALKKVARLAPNDDLATGRAGTLHIFVKAMRWQVGPPGTAHHLRLKGVIAFEPIDSLPSEVRYTFRNVPEVAHSLQLVLRSEAGGWQRDVPLTHTTGKCEVMRGPNTEKDLNVCSNRSSSRTSAFFQPSEFSLDLGPTDSPDFHLLVAGWPRRANLRRQLQLALHAPPAEAATAPPRVVRVLPYLRSVPAAAVARILAWQEQYYAPLGLSGTVLYVLPKHLLDLEEQRDIQQLVAAGRLTLVLWDELAWYKGWREFDLQVVLNHAVLSHWGSNVRLMVGDLDELIVPAVAGTTLPQLLGPGGCLSAPSLRRPACAVLQRHDVLPVAAVAGGGGGGGGEARPDEPAMWLNASGPNPLPRYRWLQRQHANLPKTVVDPNHVGQMMIHFTSVCVGPSAVAGPGSGRLQSPCTSRALCSRASESCAFVAHVANMLTARRPAANTTGMPPDWLWMLPR